MTIRELLAEESPTCAGGWHPFFPACRMKHRPVRSPAAEGGCGRTPPLPLRLCAGGGPGRRLPGSSPEAPPTPTPSSAPSPSSGSTRRPVRGKLLSGRGACQNRLPVLGARPGGLLLLVLLRPGHHPLPGTGGGAALWGAGPRRERVTCLWTATAAFSPSWSPGMGPTPEAGRACIPMTRPAIGDETGVCSRTVNLGVRALRERGFLDIQSGKKVQLSHPQSPPAPR